MITNAFTCTGSYAILIMLGIKRVENRSVMPVPAKGRCAVSCSKSFNAAEYTAFLQWAVSNLPTEDFARLPSWGDVKDWPGKIVGCCDYEVDMCPMKVRPSSDTCGVTCDEGYRYWWELSITL